MKIDKKLSKEFQQQVISKINDAPAETKADAIAEAMEMVAAETSQALADQIVAEAGRAQADAEYRKSLGLRSTFSEAEKKFYQAVKAGPKMSVTANQIDIIPTELVDRTLEDIKAESGIFDLITFAPANVKKWLTGASTGTAVWGNLTDAITAEITASISALNIEVSKLSAFIVVPKAIADLEIGFVDKYIRAKMQEVLRDGVTQGYLTGNGQTGPIGILNKIAAFKTDGTASAKTAISVTSLSPTGIKTAGKTLTHGGLRKVSSLYLLCNPLDEFEYVNPALYGDSVQGGYVQKSALPITVISDANVPQGTGVLTIAGHYTMGFSGFRVDEYKETKALDDANVIIGKVYGNGRADDDDVAVVFDITKLAPYKLSVEEVTGA